MNALEKADWILKRARKVAQEYEKKGYRVSLNPGSDLLPEGLANYRPHLLAQNEQDAVMVEWITSPALMAETDRLLQITRIVQDLPGWRLELRISNARAPTGTQPWNNPPPLKKRAIYARIGEAQALLQSEHLQAAWLVQWTATQAALCWLARQEGLACEYSDRKLLLKQLFSLGIISSEDYALLHRAAQPGQAAIQGLDAGQPDAGFVGQLIQITIRLLSE
jgi:hypothetical protein